MAKRYAMLSMAVLILLAGFAVWAAAGDASQDNGNSVIRVVVAMVQLNVAVTDSEGNYVTGLRPSDFIISEDGIRQNIATFEEGNEGPQNVSEEALSTAAPKLKTPRPVPESRRKETLRGGAQTGSLQRVASAVNGANVFILFDTSNYMFHDRGFVFAQDCALPGSSLPRGLLFL
jgi:Ca-activated chloride channel family protein